MKDYGIDGVFMQRFVVEVKPTNPSGKRHFNKVLANALKAAKKYGRAIAVMYDLSGCAGEDLSYVEQDWEELQELFSLFDNEAHPTYVRHNGKPLLAVWGVGFNDGRKYSIADAERLTPRGTKHPSRNTPVGSVFEITDQTQAFITVESATQIRGIQFWYPDQERSDPAKIIKYPPTIQVSKTSSTQGVTLSNLTFYGEYVTMDFNASSRFTCELMLIEHCYAYPLSGEFIKIDYCYDIPRIFHCHVNPAIMRKIGLRFSKAVIDAVVDNRTYAYHINHTDNAQLMDVFTFATWGGVYLGEESYGQLTNFNLDCVAVGIYKGGSNTKTGTG
jgi:hypothetical protein